MYSNFVPYHAILKSKPSQIPTAFVPIPGAPAHPDPHSAGSDVALAGNNQDPPANGDHGDHGDWESQGKDLVRRSWCQHF